MDEAKKKPELRGALRDFLVMRNLYEAAARQLTLKFEILNDEFNGLYARNPIHHIESRVKTPESIAAKLIKKGLPVSIETAREYVNDIAGVRVVCSYIDDVYRVAEMLERQKDIEIIKRQDYIATPNYNGYRSLHLDIRVPVYLSDRTEQVVAEIQIRTIAMDFWASLEHDIRYKADKSRLPEGINEEMLAVSGKIADIDRQMQDMYRRIRAAETEKAEYTDRAAAEKALRRGPCRTKHLPKPRYSAISTSSRSIIAWSALQKYALSPRSSVIPARSK